MSRSAEIETLLKQGIATAKAGHTGQAKQILMQVVELDETCVQAWLWLSGVVDDPTDKFTCLFNVLEIDPHNEHAQRGMTRLEQVDQPSPSQPAPPVPAQDPLPELDDTPISMSPANKFSGMQPFPEDASLDRSPHLQDHASVAGSLLEDTFIAHATEVKELPPDPGRSRNETYASMASALIQDQSAARGAISDFDDSFAEAQAGFAEAQTGNDLCPFCQKSIPGMTTRCQHCRLPLVVDCPACGTRLDVELSACEQCGQSMGNYRQKTHYFAQLATAYQEREEYRKAIAIWQVVALLNADHPDLTLKLAEAQAAIGRPKAAANLLQRELEKNPGDEAASLALGKILRKLGHADQAEIIYAQALEIIPESAALHAALGWLLMERKELQSGLDHVRKATRLDPENGMAWFRLGQIYEVYDNKKAAARAYRRAVELLPDNGLAQQKAQQLAGVLAPDLPPALARSWAELLRQMAGPTMICILAALLDSGMRPWWMPWTGWMALMLGMLGAWLWASGVSLPANPAMAFMMGHEQGLQSSTARVSAAIFGGFFWLLAITIILYPIGQSSPEVPEWILNLSTT